MQKCYLYIRSLSLDFQADHFDMAIAPGIDGMCCCIVFHQLIKESIAQFRWQAVGVRKPCCSNPSSAVDGLTLIEDLHHMTHPSWMLRWCSWWSCQGGAADLLRVIYIAFRWTGAGHADHGRQRFNPLWFLERATSQPALVFGAGNGARMHIVNKIRTP